MEIIIYDGYINNLSTDYIKYINNKDIDNFDLSIYINIKNIKISCNRLNNLRFLNTILKKEKILYITIDNYDNNNNDLEESLILFNNIKNLYINNSNINNIEFLIKLTKMDTVMIDYCNINYYNNGLNLSNTSLRTLNITNSNIYDINFLNNFPEIVTINIHNNKHIKDFSVLKSLNNLITIYVDGDNFFNFDECSDIILHLNNKIYELHIINSLYIVYKLLKKDKKFIDIFNKINDDIEIHFIESKELIFVSDNYNMIDSIDNIDKNFNILFDNKSVNSYYTDNYQINYRDEYYDEDYEDLDEISELASVIISKIKENVDKDFH